MRPLKLPFLLATSFALALSAPPAFGASIFESVAGDLSDDPASPEAVTFELGANSIGGAVTGGDVDLVAFTIPTGLQLDAIEFTTYTGGGLSFVGLATGDTWPTGVLASVNASLLIGADLIGANDVGTNVLPGLSGSFGSQGFQTPLPSGVYTFLMQDTADDLEYEFTFLLSAVPEPAFLALVGLVGALVVRRRRDA